MATTIEWTATVNADGSVTPGKTWNPLRGCSVISPGCHNCYAMKQGHRFSGRGGAYEGLTKQTKAGPQWTGKVAFVDEHLDDPLSWRNPSRVFVNSMADLFHESVSPSTIDRIFAVMALSQKHTFQILTKRADQMREYMAHPNRAEFIGAQVFRRFCGGNLRAADRQVKEALKAWPLPNVWLGVSVENQKYADERIPHLLQTPAAVRFISAEPLLGPIDLQQVPIPAPGAALYGITGVAQPLTEKDTEPDDWKYWTRRSAKLDWVIVGGESGNRARPFDIAWARSIVKQCADAGVACFVKQLGARPTDGWNAEAIVVNLETKTSSQGCPRSITLADRKGGDMSEWPSDLRVRQFPKAAA